MLIYLSPTIQIDILKHDTAWFPLKNPALVTIPLSFAIGMLVSLLSQKRGAAEIASFEQRERQMLWGDQRKA